MTSQMSTAHAQAEHFQFVDQSDVHAAEDIFEQLGHFRGAGGADRNDARHDLGVKRHGGAAAGWIDAADDLGNLRQAELLVAGIFALGRKGQEEVAWNVFALGARGDGAAQTTLFENGKDKFLGGAGIGGGLENDELALLQVRLDGQGGIFDVAQIGLATLIERSGHADDDGVGVLETRKVGGGAEMLAVDELLDFGLRDVLDVRLARH